MTSTLLSPMADPNSAQSATFFPTVSVIIPIYNGEQDLPNLIRGLLQQTYPKDRVEYLFVDNGSCDRTPELIATAVKTAQDQGLTFKHLSEPNIQSAYAARNTGIRDASGEILAFTDADCSPQATWLTHLVQGFQDETIGLVVGEVTALPGDTWLEHYAERKQLMSQKDTLAHPFCPYGQTANLAVRASAFKQVGLFRPYLTTGGDADLCWRVQQLGHWQLHFAEEAIVQHRHRTTLKDLYKQWYRYGKSNRYLHQLYQDVQLSRPLLPKEAIYLLSRWLIKELPPTTLKLIQGKADLTDLLMTPIGLYCFYARSLGQKKSRLPDAAQEIVTLAENQE